MGAFNNSMNILVPPINHFQMAAALAALLAQTAAVPSLPATIPMAAHKVRAKCQGIFFYFPIVFLVMNNPYDLGPMNDSYGRQQQQQFYGYPMGIGGAGGPSPLEPVTEVCTPESQTDGYGGGNGVPLAGAEPERTISRISTHV
jgi:hypothetical protein